MHHLDNLPDILLPYKDKLLATVKPAINITLKPANDLPLWASKVGGKPYLPKDMDYPTDDNGYPLLLLAQFNLSELPKTGLLPDEGILSFFISTDDGLYDDMYQNPLSQSYFKVLYFDTVSQDESVLHSDFGAVYEELEEIAVDSFFPLYGAVNGMGLEDLTCAMAFTLVNQVVSYEDFGFGRIFDEKALIDEHFKDNHGAYYKMMTQHLSCEGHHLLGYPYFTQSDPRANFDCLHDYVLLFQLDSGAVGDMEIMWGDSGVGNFFIHPDDLAKGNFSKVFFDWDSC